MSAKDNPSFQPDEADNVEVSFSGINSNTFELKPIEDDSVQVELNNSAPWKQYEDSKYDSPMLNRYVLPWPTYYKIRWMILSIFHTRLLFGFVLGEFLFLLITVGG